MTHTVRKRLAIILLFAVVTALHLWSLMRFPLPFVDEGWFACRAWALIHTGRAFGSLDAGVFDQFEGYWTFFPWVPAVIQSLGLRLTPVPTLFAVRVVSLVAGLVLLGAVYAIANRLGGWLLGLLGVFLTSVSWAFSYSAHMARIDVIAAAFGYVAIALYLNNRSSRWWVSLLSGLCVGLAFETHPHSAIYGPTIVALYFLHRRWSLFQDRGFWSFVAGVVIGLGFYAALHILPYPRTYLALNRLAFASTHSSPMLNPRLIIPAFVATGNMIFVLYSLMVPLILWAVVALALKRSTEAKTLLVLSLVSVGASALWIRNMVYYYAILFTPTVDLLVAALILNVSRQPWQRRFTDFVRRGLAWGICVAAVTLNLILLLRYDFEPTYRAVQNRVVQNVQPDESIMGPQTYWFGLWDHTYYSWEGLVYYHRYAPDSTLEDAFQNYRSDILVVDDSWDYAIADEPGDSPYSQHLIISRVEMDAFLERHAKLVDEFDGGSYGLVRVYRVSWEE